MKIVVASEGRSELGVDWHKRDPFRPIPQEDLGALELLIERVAREVHKCDVTLVGLPRLRPHQMGKSRDVALTEAIVDANQLQRLLAASFASKAPSSQGYAADAAVVACDRDLAPRVDAALQKVRPYVDGPVAQLVFDPEFEVLFFDKQAVERAERLLHCSLRDPPDEETVVEVGRAKELLKEWLKGHCSFDAGFLKRVAKVLPIPGGRPAVQKFAEQLTGLFGQKKGRPQATKYHKNIYFL